MAGIKLILVDTIGQISRLWREFYNSYTPQSEEAFVHSKSRVNVGAIHPQGTSAGLRNP